ncbi:MAG: glycosyltransferase family 2 protein [Gemmatimonadales bacterium]
MIPALDEEHSLPLILEPLSKIGYLNTIVVDNGSHDATAAVARTYGATVIEEPRRGYGAACLAGIAALADRPTTDIVAFIDADGSDDPGILPLLTEPLARGEADFVLASRNLVAPEAGALTITQRLGNWLACWFMRMLWHAEYTDLAPCRALRLGTLRALTMDDLDFGWTVQMQTRAAQAGLRVREIPSRYRCRRVGRSKISGTLFGSLRAGVTILAVLARETVKGGLARSRTV